MSLEAAKVQARVLARLLRAHFQVGEDPPAERRANRIHFGKIISSLLALRDCYPDFRRGREADLWSTLDQAEAELSAVFGLPREVKRGSGQDILLRRCDTVPEAPVGDLEWFVEEVDGTSGVLPKKQRKPDSNTGKLNKTTRDALCIKALQDHHIYKDGEIQNHDPIEFAKLVNPLMTYTGKEYGQVKWAATKVLEDYFKKGTLEPYESYCHACKGKQQLLSAFLRYFDQGKAHGVANTLAE